MGSGTPILAAAAAAGAQVGRIDAPPTTSVPTSVKMKPAGANMFGGTLLAWRRRYACCGEFGSIGCGWAAATHRSVLLLMRRLQQAPWRPSQYRERKVGRIDDRWRCGGRRVTLVSRDDAGASVTDVARVVTPETSDSTESGLANRKVRTVTAPTARSLAATRPWPNRALPVAAECAEVRCFAEPSTCDSGGWEIHQCGCRSPTVEPN
jgi:hypothetical protein